MLFFIEEKSIFPWMYWDRCKKLYCFSFQIEKVLFFQRCFKILWKLASSKRPIKKTIETSFIIIFFKITQFDEYNRIIERKKRKGREEVNVRYSSILHIQSNVIKILLVTTVPKILLRNIGITIVYFKRKINRHVQICRQVSFDMGKKERLFVENKNNDE